ncbi:DUF3316 domain-containing protein [Hoylesella buccalis]|uniref:DUF3316 domain-containing protein n=1 Tax=Hoylesella buccalis TaxID=28127 RepID=UPI001D15AA30|nr:DUF3316 domain-containing protein [Hoylesella buccalis]UEA63488.1 DUF3316 domain-containing protein [Hoylesella buccalis]UWP49221.1 DUF3316 domain-containing protein [Hoylesella buccalis ATCC 35310]
MKTWDNHRKPTWQWACIALMLCWSMSMAAQTGATPLDKITTNAKMIGWGYVDMLDTYLSPERYKGWQVNYLSHTLHEREDRCISTLSVHQGSFAHADNRAGNANEMQAMYHFAYAWHYNWHLLNRRLNVKAGGMLNTHLGMLYNTRNSNNPMQAKVGLNVALSVMASYRFSIKNKPLTVRYEADAPLLGMMFSPNYGQSYYEIFSEGNYDHNVVVTHPVNALSLRQMLTLDFSLYKTTFRIGYLGDYQQAHVNHLRYHTYSHVLVLGLVKKFTLNHLRP